ncbi:uncharacterized protein L969DRAFT_87454 [Mixia osmundae IAM 14324]|uniref:Small nuclear ribonucleoprotein G n=1 Tax=Mixia osmundae (strain CBS 9802 / IAM 14324 / JCM 22182 / KY 12970) TaxID=764103 RepID=G7E0V2_MIXOS|nr:uncharacterized protein L969DRAFT_87454 [Mixia osmundae IAM 14324]KEI39492.1 hypothetical protein L969DRAFT_87454 [Mixia osmundae IAM 14324]GAA96462.1 hypothetical protein E5Q_03129 [Mixia osmundae IAM 14324]
MVKASQPELKKYMDKRIFVNLQGNRKISGVLRGFDIFLNLVLDEAKDETPGSAPLSGSSDGVVIRGNSVSSIETLDRIR